MRANYISYFKENSSLPSELAAQFDLEIETSNAVMNVKKALHAKVKREKTRTHTVDASELFSQYRLAL
jgi:hypothetical protein